MGLTSSDLLEELLYEAHSLGVLDELWNGVSKIQDKPTPTAFYLLPLYEQVFSEIKKSLD
jgi:hypothetical protein